MPPPLIGRCFQSKPLILQTVSRLTRPPSVAAPGAATWREQLGRGCSGCNRIAYLPQGRERRLISYAEKGAAIRCRGFAG